VTLKHVQTVHLLTKAGPIVLRYLRVPNKPRVRLPSLPIDHPDFLAAYAVAMDAAISAPKNTGKAAQQQAPTGSIAALITAYLRSDLHLAHSPAYRHAVRRHLDAIRDKAGTAKARDLRLAHVRADAAQLKPSVSRMRIKAWRLICAFGLEHGLIDEDPTIGVKRKPMPATDGFPVWTADDIAAFRDRWPLGTIARRCFEVIFWTGARVHDASLLGRAQIGRDGVLAYRQRKTGDMAYVPWTCALPRHADATDHAMLQAALAGAPNALTFLATGTGQPRSHKALGHLIASAARAAGVVKSAHGLRKSRAVSLANGGASTHQIAAWTGHASLSEVTHYTAAMDRRSAVIGTEQDQNPVNNPVPSVKTAE
jgi:integrase/recombinase XerD